MFLNFHLSRTLVFVDQRRARMSSTLMKKQP